FFFSSRRRHTRSDRDWSSDVCSSDLTICHEKPNLSLSQPHWLSCPPPDVSLFQYSSISFCVSQFTTNEKASLNLNNGPPFSAVRSEERRVGKERRSRWGA